MEFISFVILLACYFATGVYALGLFRAHPRISTFVYVWLAAGGFFISGAAYRMWSGHPAYYTDGLGGTHYLTHWEYSKAMLAAGAGLICMAIGHAWGKNRNWGLAIPRFLDGRVSNAHSMRRWAILFLAAGLVPLAATGIENPFTLISALLHGRNVTGAAVALYSQGTLFSFAQVFSHLVPFGIAATALLFWTGKRPILPLCLTAFLIFITVISGTRSAAAFTLAPFIVLPRYLGQFRRFQKLTFVGGAVLLVLFEVQLVYRNSGFNHVNVINTVAKASPISALGGKELDYTGEAIATYGTEFHYLDGQSYYAVIVNPVPRIFWRSKPVGYSDTNALNLGYPSGTTMTSGWMGEAYANFGWWGIPIVGLIAGALMGWLDVMLRGAGIFATAVLLPLQFQWAFWVRGDSVSALDPWIFGLVLAVALLAIFNPISMPEGEPPYGTMASP